MTTFFEGKIAENLYSVPYGPFDNDDDSVKYPRQLTADEYIELLQKRINNLLEGGKIFHIKLEEVEEENRKLKQLIDDLNNEKAA
jgi:hypothetical protein